MLHFRLHFLSYMPKLALLISQGSAATHYRYGGNYYMVFVGNLLLFPAVKNFKNPLRIDSYRHELGHDVKVHYGWVYYLFETQCSYPLHAYVSVSYTVNDMFGVEYWRDVKIWVWSCSRSLNMR